MGESDQKADLRRYLQDTRGSVLWKLEGLSEYDVRRPLVPTGTNLLGLVKHLACVEIGYFGDTFGRPFAGKLPWDEADPNSDMFATPGESREFITGLYRQAWAHSDATIEALELDATGHVPWSAGRKRGHAAPRPRPGYRGNRPARGARGHHPRTHRRHRRADCQPPQPAVNGTGLVERVPPARRERRAGSRRPEQGARQRRLPGLKYRGAWRAAALTGHTGGPEGPGEDGG